MELIHQTLKFILITLLLLMVGCNGCEDDGIPTPMGEECIGNACMGVALCNNGYCECPNTTQQLAPGFCIQDYEGAATFVTYDVHEGLLDTTILTFVEEPFDLTWEVGDPVLKTANGTTYNRNPYALTIGRETLIALYLWPGDLVTPVDSIVILQVYDKSNNQHGHWAGEWVCRSKQFRGRFVDRDHIVGEIVLALCDTEGNTPRPVEIQETTRYPVTYTRWR